MDTIDSRSQVRYLQRFLAVLAGLLGCATLAFVAKRNLRDLRVDFQKHGADTVVLIGKMVSRSERADLRLGFADIMAVPRIGNIGNHQTQLMSEQNFSGRSRVGYFYNYWYESMTLREARDYVAFLKDTQRLPRDLVLISVTTPHADNGAFIVDHHHELPTQLAYYYERTRGSGAAADLWRHRLQMLDGYAYKILDWKNMIANGLDFVVASPRRYRVINRRVCEREDRHRGETRPSPEALLLFGVVAVPPTAARWLSMGPVVTAYCNRELSMGFAYDGSSIDAGTGRGLVLNQVDMGSDNRGLVAGDEDRIAGYMRDIDELLSDGHRRVVFLIPPVYESERASFVDGVMTRALDSVPELEVVDHRHRHAEKENFVEYLHPNARYFDLVVEELRKRRVLPPGG
ncbi:MAG: hypothetical protein V3V08_22740 [Nannocystaceae bacterium]